MNNKEYIREYVDKLNKELDTYICPEIEDAELLRYPLYCNCVERVFYLWEDLFESLSANQKDYIIIFSYAILLDADISLRNQDYNKGDSIRLAIDPNKLTKVLCKIMNVPFRNFDEMQRVVYHKKQLLFPFPDTRGTFFKVGDEIKTTIFHYKVIDVYSDDGAIMVKAHSLNNHNNITKIIAMREREMIDRFIVTKPVEFRTE